MCKMTKDYVRVCIFRVIDNLKQQIRQNSRLIACDIPHVGVLVVRKNVAGVKFHGHLVSDTKTVLSTKHH